MEWLKIPTDSILYSEFKDEELIILIKYQALYCQLESEPTLAQMGRIFSKKEIKFLENFGEIVKNLCENQIKTVSKKRNRDKEHYKKKQSLSENSANGKLSESQLKVIEPTSQIRIDKNNKEISTNVLTKKVNKFVPPTLEEIDTYIAEKNLSVSGRDFFEYFETGNWIDSKGQKVKNWKQKLLTWDKNGIGKRVKTEKPDLVQQNRANLWAFVQDSGAKI